MKAETIPDFIPPEAWSAFVEMRVAKGSKTPWTAGARKRSLELLAEAHEAGENIAEILWTCTEHGWAGIKWGRAEVAKQAMRGGLVARSRSGSALSVIQGMKR